MSGPQFSDAELMYLTRSADFQAIFAADPVLDELERERYNDHLEFLLVMDALHQCFRIGSAPVQSITPAVWSILWTIGNAYTRRHEKNAKDPTDTDADIFLWMLANGSRASIDLHEIPGAASGFVQSSGLTFEQADAEIGSMIALAFAPLALLPPKKADGEAMRYDADWLVWLSSLAAKASNESMSYCMTGMPLSVCYWHYINNQRSCDYKHEIRRRPDAEICRAILDRSNELCRDFLKKKYRKKK